MTRLLAFIILFLNFIVHGQGLGPVEQPFFAQASQGNWVPTNVPGAYYWWVASDLPDGAVNTWTDRVSGVVFTNMTGSGITKSSNYVYFDGTAYMTNASLYLTNNFISAAILRPYTRRYGITTPIDLVLWGDTDGVGYDVDFKDLYTDGHLQWVVRFIGGGYATFSEFIQGPWMNIVLCVSNGISATYGRFYTNGLIDTEYTAATVGTYRRLGWNDATTLSNFQGWIGELVLYTNVNDWRSTASNFNWYSTNTYINPIPYASETAFVTNTTLGTSRNNYTGRVGFKFFPLREMTVTALARWNKVGNIEHRVIRLKNSAGTDLASGTIILTNYPTGDYAYTNLASPVTLPPRLVYYLETDEVNAKDSWYDNDTVVMPQYHDGIIIGHAVNETGGTTTNASYVPVNFKYK